MDVAKSNSDSVASTSKGSEDLPETNTVDKPQTSSNTEDKNESDSETQQTTSSDDSVEEKKPQVISYLDNLKLLSCAIDELLTIIEKKV